MFLPPYLGPLIYRAAEYFPGGVSQLVYMLLYALALSLWIQLLVRGAAYVDYRYAYTLRTRGETPSDAQRFAGASLEFLFKWGRRALMLLAIFTGLWLPFAVARLHYADRSPPWLSQGVNDWERQVLARAGAPPLIHAPPPAAEALSAPSQEAEPAPTKSHGRHRRGRS